MNSTAFLDTQYVRSQIERVKLSYPELAEDAELWADTLEGETELNEVLTVLLREERDACSFAEAIKGQIASLFDRRARFLSKQEAIRSLMLSLLETAQQSKVTLPEATISLLHVAPKPIVDSAEALPDALCRYTRGPDLTAIKKAFEAGENVTGAHMSNGSTSISIRVK